MTGYEYPMDSEMRGRVSWNRRFFNWGLKERDYLNRQEGFTDVAHG